MAQDENPTAAVDGGGFEVDREVNILWAQIVVYVAVYTVSRLKLSAPPAINAIVQCTSKKFPILMAI